MTGLWRRLRAGTIGGALGAAFGVAVGAAAVVATGDQLAGARWFYLLTFTGIGTLTSVALDRVGDNG